MKPPSNGVPLRCRRFVYGYALDHSEYPCYLVWPCRTDRVYHLLDTNTKDQLERNADSFFRPLGLQHFYASFALDSRVSLRDDALEKFQLAPEDLTTDLRVSAKAAARKRWGNHFEQPTDQVGLEVDRNRVPADVITLGAGEVDQDSSDTDTTTTDSCSTEESSESDTTTENNGRSPPADDMEQYELMTTAFAQVKEQCQVVEECLVGGLDSLQALESLLQFSFTYT